MNHGGRIDPRHMDDQLEGYVLGALDGDQQRVVNHHLTVCPRCRRLADGLAAVAAHLAFASPLRRPPLELKARVLAAAQVADQSSAVLPFVSAAPHPRQLRTRAWLLIAAAPWLLVAVLGIAWWIGRPPAQRPSVLSTITLSGPSGVRGVLTMEVGARQGALVLTHLTSFPRDKTFVCWLERTGQAERVCTFHLRVHQDDAVVMLTFARPWTNNVTIGVSAESAPLPSRPSGTFLATAQLR